MNSISDEDAVFVEPPDNAEADRTRVIPGDVLLTITGSEIGRVATVPDRLNGAYISQHVAILRLKAGLLPEFLSMFLFAGKRRPTTDCKVTVWSNSDPAESRPDS